MSGFIAIYPAKIQVIFLTTPSIGMLNERPSAARWRPAFQQDFMARVKWAKEPFVNVNHNLKLVVNGVEGTTIVELETHPGEIITLDASQSSDPDGDALDIRWSV